MRFVFGLFVGVAGLDDCLSDRSSLLQTKNPNVLEVGLLDQGEVLRAFEMLRTDQLNKHVQNEAGAEALLQRATQSSLALDTFLDLPERKQIKLMQKMQQADNKQLFNHLKPSTERAVVQLLQQGVEKSTSRKGGSANPTNAVDDILQGKRITPATQAPPPQEPTATVTVELADGQVFTELVDVQRELSNCRANVIPFALWMPEPIKELLRSPGSSYSSGNLTDIKNHFLSDRKEVAETILSVREPYFSDGGSMETSRLDSGGYEYPTIYVADEAQSVQGFDVMHFNSVDADGVQGVDEVMTLVRGGAVWFYKPVDGGLPIKFTVTASSEVGWKVTYDGAVPHGFQNGESMIMAAQIVGPPEWTMHFRPEMENPWVSEEVPPAP